MSANNYIFGSGAIWVTPKFDVFGNKNLNPSPIMLGAVQDFSVDMSADLKELKGSESQFALALARSAMTISGKFKFANIYGDAISTVFLGKAMEDGATAIVQDTVGHTIASGLTVTITAPNSGTFSNDLGVVNATTLEPLKNVASNPATGQYSVDEATGVYTFASADVGNKVYINFNYDVSTVGKSVAMDKIAMGPTPSFRLDVKLSGPDGQQFLLTLYKCVSSKLSLATKFDEFMQPEVEFKAQLDEYNRAFKLSEL